jgi:periplasmic protein TonB
MRVGLGDNPVIVIRYNITKWGGPRPVAAIGPPVTVDETRVPLSGRTGGRLGFGALSVLLHAAAIGVLVLVVSPPVAPPPLEQAPIELVFEQPPAPPEATPVAQPEAPPPVEQPPLPEVGPEPPVPVPPEPPPEPPPPPVVAPAEPKPPEPPPPEVPEPSPPPPPPPPPPLRVTPPRPRPPARPPAREPVAQRPAPPAVTTAPAPVPPSSTAPAPVAPAAPGLDRAWVASVSAFLAARKTYPEEARRRGEEGRVAVRFTVDRSGRVTQAVIVSPSGSALLDEAALGLLRQAVLPAFPPDMTQVSITITTTMRYSLR